MKHNFSKLIFSLAALLVSLAACAQEQQKQLPEAESQDVEMAAAPVGEVRAIDMNQFAQLVADWHADEWKFIGQRPCVIDFNATWCGPCRQLAPILKDLAKEYAGKVDFYSIDVDENRPLAQAFGVSSIPLLIFCPMEGTPDGMVGLHPKDEITEAINQMLAK